MHSVALDIFSLPTATWQEIVYDSLLLCVDRLSGWIWACPTAKVGLTAEKAAHLILDKGWEPFGVPSVVHSDMGPQFVGQWWATMCARLGIRTSHSPPHRPRANGRAERAGQQVLSILKTLHNEKDLNWVESLPRVLRILHDTVGEAGLSPYHIMFGRDRTLPGIPFTPTRICEDASDFFDRMAHIDATVSSTLMALHAHRTASSKPEREEYQVGDLVWTLKPATLESQAKLEPRWNGPLVITFRLGQHTYVVRDRRGLPLTVFIDQLKPYLSTGDVEELDGLPLHDPSPDDG